VSGRAGPAGLAFAGGRAGIGVALLAGVLGFLAVPALALALAAGRLEVTWRGEMIDTATLQVVAAPDEVEEQARAALNVLRATPGVEGVRIIEIDEQRALLEPWLGPEIAVDSLPLPLMIEVAADRSALDRADLDRRLAAEAPGAVFDDHAAWREPLVENAGRLRLFMFGCLGLLALALAAGLALAADGAATASARAIQTLRLVGARDRWIAGAFSRRFARHALIGAAAGAAAGTALVALLPAASEPGFFLIGIRPDGWHWALPLAVPVVAAALAWAAARRAARRGLRNWS
jgi:cell division transport system permease protein